MFKISAMDHIVLNVPDINRSLAFYMDVLGLEPERLDQFRRGEVPFPCRLRGVSKASRRARRDDRGRAGSAMGSPWVWAVGLFQGS